MKRQEVLELSTVLEDIVTSLPHFIPELSVFFLALVIFSLDFFVSNKQRIILFAALGLIVVFVTSINQWLSISNEKDIYDMMFGRMLIQDHLAVFSKFIIILSTALVLVIALTERTHAESIRNGEFVFLVLMVLLGSMILLMGNNLLIIYLSLEMVSIGSYALASLGRDRNSTESGLKYLIYGGVSSAVMLYGISMLYGFTGTLDMGSSEFLKGTLAMQSLPLMLISFMTLGGFLFKISAVPFHIWTPSVYQGAPTSVAAFLSVVPKVAGVIILIRFLSAYDKVSLAFAGMNFDWQQVMAFISALTMFAGNLGALWQQDAKRLLAYSSIAHTGFLLIGVVAYSETGIQLLFFYLTVYAIMNLLAFLAIIIFSNVSGSMDISAWKGLGNKMPLWSVIMLLVMVSLTGLPPTAGFSGKLLILSATWATYQFSKEPYLVLLIVAGGINTVISLFYYLKIPYFLFFKDRGKKDMPPPAADKQAISLGLLLAISLVVLFAYPQWVIEVIKLIKFTFYSNERYY